MILESLYEIQAHLLRELPKEGGNVRKALDTLDKLIDELEANNDKRSIHWKDGNGYWWYS